MLVVVGLSHRNAPIEVRERLAVPAEQLPRTLRQLSRIAGVQEVLLLSTCNRVEIYAVADGPGAVDSIAGQLGGIGGKDVLPHLVKATEQEAVRHLFRVASSLDSLVVGEPQILGQLKDAIAEASKQQTLGPKLDAAMRCALHLAKRVRSETKIGAGQVSVPSVAVDLAEHIFADLAGRQALLVGAGEMAETAARQLARHGADLVVVNRSAERAKYLAGATGGEPALWEDLTQGLIRADIVLASTSSPEPIITVELLKRVRHRRRGRTLFLIDIAVPRNVEAAVNDLDNVYLYDIDDLSLVVAQSLQGRAAEAQRAEDLVAAETESFMRRSAERALAPVIVGLRERTSEILTAELERTVRGRLKHLSPKDLKSLHIMINAAVNKLLHQPITRLKGAADTPHGQRFAEAVCELFDLPAQGGEGGEQADPVLAAQVESWGGAEPDNDDGEPVAEEQQQRIEAR